MKKEPRISVLTSCYNSSAYVRESIESVLSQPYTNFEFILINDGSTDNTLTILNEYALRDERIVVINKSNTGLTDSLNQGLQLAKGVFVARLDADDIVIGDRFTKQINFLHQHPDIALAGSNAYVIDLRGTLMSETVLPSDIDELKHNVVNKLHTFPHSSIMFNKNEVMSIGGYNERFIKAQDFDLYLRLYSNNKKIACIGEKLIKLRAYMGSTGNNDSQTLQARMALASSASYFRRISGLVDYSSSSEEKWHLFFDAVNTWYRKMNLQNKVTAKLYFQESRRRLKNHDISNSLTMLAKAFSNDPLFLFYKGMGLRIPEDLNEIIKMNI